MKPKAKGQRDGLIRVVLWGIVMLALVVGYLDANPVTLESDERVEPGRTIVLDAESDVLLVVDYDAFPSAPESFDELDCSLAWLNPLQQEIGPTSLKDAATLPDTELSRFRIVVLTRSAGDNAAWLPKLEGFVDRGGVLVLEMPQGRLREAFSADGLGGLRDPQRITGMTGLAPELFEQLTDLPLNTRLIGSSGPLEGAETLMTIDGIPVIYRKKLGAGWVVTFDFDFGMLITSIQQGRPQEGFRLRNRRGTEDVDAADLALDDSLVTSEVPVGDLLERFVVYGVIDPIYPVVGFWPFIDGMDGAFVVTHDERGMGDPAAWMAEHEAGFNGSSTYLVRVQGSITREGLENLVHLGVDVGLEWNRPLDERGAYKHIGFWGIEPVRKTLSLAEQSELLRGELEELPPLVSVRIRDHLWGRDWVEPFRAMSAAELRADSTYAPPEGVPGFAFGTGLPFMPIDETGLAFDILEFPNVLLAAGGEGERDALVALLESSQASSHEALGVSFAPSAFEDHPSALLYETWRDAYKLAAEHGHWITSVRNLYRFSRARHNSELRSRRVETNLDGRGVALLRIETLALESGMAASVPAAIGERVFVDARRGVNRAQGDQLLAEKVANRPVVLMGYNRVLLPLSKGFNAIDVVYE